MYLLSFGELDRFEWVIRENLGPGDVVSDESSRIASRRPVSTSDTKPNDYLFSSSTPDKKFARDEAHQKSISFREQLRSLSVPAKPARPCE
jgi:hypothetical protein